MDPHPSRSVLNRYAVEQADLIIVPAICEDIYYRGVINVENYLRELMQEIHNYTLTEEQVEKHINDILRIVPTRYRVSKKIDRTYLKKYKERYPGLITSTLNESSVFGKSREFKLSIFNMKKSVTCFEDEPEFLESFTSDSLIGITTKNDTCIVTAELYATEPSSRVA